MKLNLDQKSKTQLVVIGWNLVAGFLIGLVSWFWATRVVTFFVASVICALMGSRAKYFQFKKYPKFIAAVSSLVGCLAGVGVASLF